MNKRIYPMSWHQAVDFIRADPEQEELVRSCYYDDPVFTAAQRFWASSEWKAVRKLLPVVPGKVLDAGAGRGISSFAFAKDGWRVTALEPDFSNIVGAGAIRELEAASGLELGVTTNWGEQLPFADASFDAVYCRAVLHHALDLRQFCKEAGRVLKPGGLFLATREHVISSKGDLQQFYDTHPLHNLYGGEHAFTIAEYLDAIRTGGFVVKSTFNPYASDINLFPDSKAVLRKRISDRLKVPCFLLPDFLLRLRGATMSTPGRLYTFIAQRRFDV